VCGHDCVLCELLTKEAAHITLHLLNGGHLPGYSYNGPLVVLLHLAAAVGCTEVVDLLALTGTDVNVTNGRGGHCHGQRISQCCGGVAACSQQQQGRSATIWQWSCWTMESTQTLALAPRSYPCTRLCTANPPIALALTDNSED